MFFFERYFGIQAMFVDLKERSKGFGGCFLSLLQDFGRIVTESKNILPIFLIQTRENENKKMLIKFYAKYFLVKPTNKEDILLIEQIRRESKIVDLSYYMILRLPLIYVLEMKSTIDTLPTAWENLISMSKNLTIPVDVTHLTNSKYSYVEKIINILFHGNSDDTNWSKINVKKWVQCLVIHEKEYKKIGKIEIAKNFFILKGVISNPIMFDDDKTIAEGKQFFASSATLLICKNEIDIQRVYTFMSLVCLMISKIMATDNRLFLEEYKKKYETYFAKKVTSLVNKNNIQNLNIIFKEMSTMFMNHEIHIGSDEYCFIANCFCYDVISLMPYILRDDYNEPVTYKQHKYYLWRLKKTIYKGFAVENNRKAVIVVKTQFGKFLLSFLNRSSSLSYTAIATKSYKINKELSTILTAIASSHPNLLSFLNNSIKKYLNQQNESTFKVIKFPYGDWLQRPQHFCVNNDLVSVIVSEDIKDADSAVGFLKKIKQFFDPKKKLIEVIDVKNDCIAAWKWSFNELLDYFESNDREHIYNQVSLEISNIDGLISKFKTPRFVKEVDWIDTLWLFGKEGNYPKIQYYLLTSVEGCYMDFHIDMNGSTVWYHVIIGKKEIFWLSQPKKIFFYCKKMM